MLRVRNAIGESEFTQFPDEDSFSMPSAWRRHVHPRRGGIRRPAAPPVADAVERTGRRIAEERAWIGQFIADPRSDVRLTEAAQAQLDGRADAVGAAVIASVVGFHPMPMEIWADAWAASHGLAFAAQAMVECFEVDVHYTQSGSRRYDPWLGERAESARRYVSRQHRPLADRIRALLAEADEETYRETVAALAKRRDGARRRIVASYLVPGEADWVAECCADPGASGEGGEGDTTVRSMLFCSLNSPEQVGLLGGRAGFGWPLGTIATVTEGIGPAVAPLLAEVLSNPHLTTDSVKLAAGALIELPTDEAFGVLLSGMDDKRVRPSLIKATHRYPVRALRMLAGAPGPLAKQLLTAHIGVHHELARAALPLLDERTAAVVAAAADREGRIEDAPADSLPALLTGPPWTRKRSGGKAKVVGGLDPVAEPRIAWLPGEREEWAATRSWYRTWSKSQKTNWDEASLRAELLRGDVRSAALFVDGPVELIRPMLGRWDPDSVWDGEAALKPLAASYELEALPALRRVAARQPGTLATLLLPYVDTEVARMMADWLIRLKSTAATARSWFVRHGADAAALLVPDAVGKAGPARRRAEQALRVIAGAHGNDAVRAAAAGYGPEAATVIDGLLAADPLENALPARMPAPVEWAEPALLPQIRVRTGGALPADATRHAITMLAVSRPGEAFPGVAALKELCDAGSLAEFGWALFEQWRLAGMPANESWALHGLGLLGDDGTVRRLTPILRTWPGEGAHHRAVEGLDVLAAIGTDAALLHLHGVAQRVKFKALKVRAQEKIAEVAEGLGLTGEQLADRLVPDLGLGPDGSTVVDYGTRRFTVGFDEQLRPYVLDEDGKRRKDLPQPGARDDAELAPAERKRFMVLKKDVRTIASDQVHRLESAMVSGRSWTAAEFRELFVAHPLLWHLVRRLVWLSTTDSAVTAFRVTGDRTFADAADDEFALPDTATVRLAHPLHLGDALAVWSGLFADREILQPFPQLGRPVFRLTDEEAAGGRLPRFEGITVPTGRLLGLERRGWQRGEPQDAGVECWITKQLGPDLYAVVNPHDGIAVGAVDMFPEQALDAVWLHDEPGDWSPPLHGNPLRFGSLDPVTASELLADLTELTAG